MVYISLERVAKKRRSFYIKCRKFMNSIIHDQMRKIHSQITWINNKVNLCLSLKNDPFPKLTYLILIFLMATNIFLWIN